ncbi:MAG: hypothetical protein GX201_13865 [Clostridiales bacterium]|nr:hypothetical protein [Clostridiales bacterium]
MAKKVAYGGILTALSLVILYLAFCLPSMKITMYFLASIVPGLMLVEMGVNQAWILYGATCLLAITLLGNPASAIPYIFIFGLYPIIKYYIEKIRRMDIEIFLKLLFLNGTTALIYFIWKNLFMVNIVINIPVIWGIIGIQPVFVFYDYIFTRVIFYYCDNISIKWRKNL